MGFAVALFTDMHTYKIKEADDIGGMVQIACEFTAGKGYKRGWQKTDPWMNRYCIFENNEKKYIIIPSKIPCGQNNFVSTAGRFAVFLIEKGELASITSEDIEFFMENYPAIFSTQEIEKQERDFHEGMMSAEISSYFSFLLLAVLSDEQLLKLKEKGMELLQDINPSVFEIAEKMGEELFKLSVEKALVLKDMDI